MRFVNTSGFPAGLRSMPCVWVLIVSLYDKGMAYRNRNDCSAWMWFFTMDFAAYMNQLWSCHKKMGRKSISKKNMLTDLFKFSFYTFAQLIFSYCKSWELPLFASSPCSISQLSLLLKRCQAEAAMLKVLLDLTASQQHLGKRNLDLDQKTANGNGEISYVLQTSCSQPLLSPTAPCNQFFITPAQRCRLAHVKCN